jgi:preprotein translocase subunit SecD
MARRNGLVLVIILIIFGLTVWVSLPNSTLSEKLGRKDMRLGLDLVGGVYLVYQGNFSENTTSADMSAAMDREVTIIQKRIDTLGVTEPIIQKLGDDRILVQLPGFTDIDEAKKQVEQVGFLEFREVELNTSGAIVYLKDYLSANVTDFFDVNEPAPRLFVNDTGQGSDYGKFIAFLSKEDGVLTFTDANGNPVDNATLQQYGDMAAWIPARGDPGPEGQPGTPLTGDLLSSAQATLGGSLGTTPEVDITWNSEGAVIFDQIAVRLYNPTDTYSLDHALGIFLDNNLISAPQVRAQAFYGKGTISGSFTRQSAEDLANLLKSGALPVQLQKNPLYQETVSATLGTDSLNSSLRAGIIGIAIVMLFMIAYYRFLGGVATAALFVYGAISLSIFKLIPVTLTLPGIAGFIISVGMAVDANILIFERMKEEMRWGRTLEASVSEGFRRAWPSIRDSNIATFITCIILYWFGSSFGAFMVKGFALTLFIGVAVSMFSAIMVTRTFLIALIRTQLKQGLLGSIK